MSSRFPSGLPASPASRAGAVAPAFIAVLMQGLLPGRGSAASNAGWVFLMALPNNPFGWGCFGSAAGLVTLAMIQSWGVVTGNGATLFEVFAGLGFAVGFAVAARIQWGGRRDEADFAARFQWRDGGEPASAASNTIDGDQSTSPEPDELQDEMRPPSETP